MSIIKRSGGDERYIRMNFFCASLGSMVISLSISFFSYGAIRILGVMLVFVGIVILTLPPFLEEKTSELEEGNSISPATEKYSCLTAFCFAAVTLCFTGWLPSFCVMMKIFTKEEAARLMLLLSCLQLLLRASSTYIKMNGLSFLKITCSYTALGFGPLAFVLFGIGFRMFLVFTLIFYFPFIMFMFLPSLLTLPSHF